jgi:glycosyltransferase involved in cell wall biosynthesis
MSPRLAHALSDRMVSATPETYPLRGKLVPVGHGIDTERFSPDGPPAAQVLCVGRLSPVKDHATLLRAAAKIGARVAVVGPVLDEGYARSLRGIHDGVEWVGPVPQDELPGWYRRCAVHVNLAGPGFGDKVALEAMACGRPCLMASGVFRETLGRYAERLLFRAGDADDLAAKLKALLAAPDLAQMGAYLRAQVVRLHGLDGLADRIVGLLRELRRR